MRFSDSLDRAAEDVKRPPVLPVGHYLWSVKAVPEVEDVESKRTGDTFDTVTVLLSCVEASDDVDPDELEAYGNPQGATMRKVFWFNTTEGKEDSFAKTEYYFKQFMAEHLALGEDHTLGGYLTECVGAQCLGEVTHRPNPENAEEVFAEIGRTTAQ